MKDDFYSLYCEAVEENERLKKENKSLKIQERKSVWKRSTGHSAFAVE